MMNIENPQNEPERFGKMIRERRTAPGMTLEVLAERANRSDREVRDIELGKVEPKLRSGQRYFFAMRVRSTSGS